ncbi:MAG: hypothetical protein DMF61_01285 [Blastocatellia bacterium AA13]|nr:MAG: hypothetical protein DMF61_01285 [Blastocatellia bacterium AA13]
MSGTTPETCESCGAALATGARFCVACYKPVASRKNRARDLTSPLGKDDPTIVFVPQNREARLKREKLRKRITLFGMLLVLGGSAAVGLWHSSERERLAKRRVVAREELALREIRLFADALERFKTDVGRYPTSDEGIGSLMAKPATARFDGTTGLAFWSGPYLDGYYELDPWGNDYVYRSGKDSQSYEVFSNGPDGDEPTRRRLRAVSPN